MKSFEWKVYFVVEGLLPSELPKNISEEGVLENFVEGKRDEAETRAILSLKILRQSIPSDKEMEEVRRIARERAGRLVMRARIGDNEIPLADGDVPHFIFQQ